MSARPFVATAAREEPVARGAGRPLLLLWLVAACLPTPAQLGDQLADPSFEQGDPATFRGPVGWKTANSHGRDYTATLSTDVVRTGRHSLCVSGRGEWIVWTTPPTACEAGRACAASVWVAVEQGLAAVKLDFQDEDGKWLASSLPVKVAGPRGWTEVLVRARGSEVAGAERASQVALALALEGTGTVWFDDVRFGPVEGEAGGEGQPDNLLSNSSFEQGTVDVVPGWSLGTRPVGSFQARAVAREAPDGDRCVELSGEGEYALLSSSAIPSDRRATYRATAWVTASGPRFRAFLKIDHYRGARFVDRVQSEHVQTEGDWAEVTVTSGPGQRDGIDQVRAVLVLEGEGTAWFDEVRLVAE